jgi:hypothetical protein
LRQEGRLEPESSGEDEISQEGQKDKRRALGVRAAARGSGAAWRAERRGEQLNLLIF